MIFGTSTEAIVVRLVTLKRSFWGTRDNYTLYHYTQTLFFGRQDCPGEFGYNCPYNWENPDDFRIFLFGLFGLYPIFLVGYNWCHVIPNFWV